jgi:hypothetical protein
MEINEFKIRSYGWTELALRYNPEVAQRTALQRLKFWVSKNQELTSTLQDQGWRKGDRLLTPLQVETIVRYLGEP